MRRRARFRAVALLAVIVLSAVPAFAGGRQTVRSTEAHSVFASLWQALSEFLPVMDARQSVDPDGVRLKGRGTIDPDGAPTSATPTEDPSDGRGTIDPNG